MDNKTPPAESGKTMTAADAAKQVRRSLMVLEDGKDGQPVQRLKQVAVAASEVAAFKNYGSHVVVVTTDGQKFSSEAA